MISDIKPLFISRASYTAVIQGNGGENEIAISVSIGQDAQARILASAPAVDGGMEALALPLGAGPGKPLEIAATGLLPALRTILQGWAYSGIKPRGEELARIDEDIAAIVGQLAAVWLLDEDEQLNEHSEDPEHPWKPIFTKDLQGRMTDDFTIPLPGRGEAFAGMDPAHPGIGDDLLNKEPSLLLRIPANPAGLLLTWNEAYNLGYALQRIAEIAYFG